jgi:hypothetical protein
MLYVIDTRDGTVRLERQLSGQRMQRPVGTRVGVLNGYEFPEGHFVASGEVGLLYNRSSIEAVSLRTGKKL